MGYRRQTGPGRLKLFLTTWEVDKLGKRQQQKGRQYSWREGTGETQMLGGSLLLYKVWAKVHLNLKFVISTYN